MCFIVCVLLCFILYIALFHVAYVYDVAALWRNNKLLLCRPSKMSTVSVGRKYDPVRRRAGLTEFSDFVILLSECL